MICRVFCAAEGLLFASATSLGGVNVRQVAPTARIPCHRPGLGPVGVS